LTNHNQSQAAKLLDIQRTYLNRLIKELGISSSEE
jgi:DNA-binding NtrC family response regulator